MRNYFLAATIIEKMTSLLYFIFITGITKLENLRCDSEILKKFMEIQSIDGVRVQNFYPRYKFDPLVYNAENLETILKTLNAVNFNVIILALDEARGLFDINDGIDGQNGFRLFRRALGNIDDSIHSGSRIFVILCNTTSRISNFAPQQD